MSVETTTKIPAGRCRYRRHLFVDTMRRWDGPAPRTGGYSMTKYMLAVHTVDDEGRPAMTHEEMAESMRAIDALEAEMESTGVWVFSGRLTEPGDARIVAASGGEVLTTDGPFAESKEHLAGFYIIEVEDGDAALRWAVRVTAAVGAPIEARPFSGTGRVSEQAASSA